MILRQLAAESIIREGGRAERGSHAIWLENFLSAMEVEVNESLANSGGEHYQRRMEALINDGATLSIVGAILMAEYAIPHEFRILQTARNARFPEMGAKGRLYLDDHIAHDESAHLNHALLKIIGGKRVLWS